jgi:hypothetical protein
MTSVELQKKSQTSSVEADQDCLHSRKLHNAMFLRAERRPDGTRTFRVPEAEPLQTSYGKDLFAKVFAAEEPADVPMRRTCGPGADSVTGTAEGAAQLDHVTRAPLRRGDQLR